MRQRAVEKARQGDMSNAPDRSEEIDRGILKRYEISNKLGKGVRLHILVAYDRERNKYSGSSADVHL